MADEPTDARLDAMGAAILPLLPIPAAKLGYAALPLQSRNQLRSIARAAYAEAIKEQS